MNEECKMQSDQEAKSHGCPKCSLIFKSKVYLFEHLNKVHCLNVDASLRNAGLKTADIQKAIADNSRCPEKNVFKCQLCDFTTFNLDVLTNHKKQYHENLTETGVNHEKRHPDTKIIDISTNQCNSAAEAEDEPCVETTPISNCTPNSSKNLKMYKRPLQTVTKVFSGSPDLNEHPYAKLADNTKETLILQETTSSSLNPIWSGVCKVNAMSMINISHVQADLHLREDRLLIPALRASKPKEHSKEVHNQGDKGATGPLTTDYYFEGPSAKKFKSKNEATVLPESKNPNEQPSGGAEFSFEVSDDEEKKSSIVVKEDPPNPKVFFCKICDYSDRSFKCIISHYQNEHPYVRCNTAFIQDSNDQSATFRCLECPVEFPSSVDLKWHYTEKHPEAPDVFNLKLNELSLAFKCFSCPFTSNRSKALREHYKEKHPTCEIDSSLLFCQYSLSKCQEESPQVQTCKKVPSLEKSRERSPERVVTPCKDVKDVPSPQQPSPTLYRCNKCEFTHKSSVVMQVHYKRKHPKQEVTIDEIKRVPHKISLETSQMMPENESPEKANDKQEKPLQMKIKLSPLESSPKVSKNRSKQAESVQDETPKMSHSKPNRKMTSGLDDSSSSSPGEIYYCMFCDYTSALLKSVVGHHCSKHSHLPVSQQDIVEYSAGVRKKLMSKNPAKARKGIKKSREDKAQFKEDNAVDASGKKSNDYADAETLFYCQRCNLGNPTLQGVLNHQIHTHESLNVKAEIIMKHTASIRDNIKRSKSRGKGSKSSTYLPLPIVNKGDENKFFCHLCNFRQTTLTKVLHHYSRYHQGCVDKSAVVHQYTTRVLKWLQRSLSKSAAQHAMLQKTENGTNKANNSIKSPDSVSPSAGGSETQRNLKCLSCSYSTPYVYLLRAHLRKIHRSNRPVKDILGFCFRQGALKEGYHCEWCVFSDKNANSVYKHYQESHPQRRSSLEYIRTRLFVGPNKPLLQKEKPKLESADSGDGADGPSTDKSSKQIESETYSCTRCSFKSRSKSSLSRHTKEIHAKNSLDSLSSEDTSAKSQLEELSEMPGVFESFQMPFEEMDEAITSSTSLQCPFPSTSDTENSLITHSQTNHGKSFDAKKEEKQPANTQTQIHLFKCRHCNYFNTLSQGILTHSYMKHPSLTCKTDSLYLSPAQIHDCMRKNEAGEIVKFSGYICKICPQICKSLYRMNRHREREHNKTLKPVSKVKSGVTPAKPYSTQESVSKASFFSKHKYTKVKCQHCSFFCNTKTALSRHMQKEHLNTFSKDCLFKCMLCHRVYFLKNKLRNHYLKFHGKPAFLKHYVPVYEQFFSKPEPHDHLQEQNKLSEGKLLIYKCPRCSYIHVTHHGILTHCQMKHPAIVARGYKLETSEILLSNIVKCSNGKGKYERGYQCTKCPQIHPSMASLNAHKCEHGKMAASEESLETVAENPPTSVSEPGPLKNQTAKENTAEIDPSLSATKTSSSLPLLNKECSYQCQVCTYKTATRPKLRDHYKYTHKFNAASVYKLLEKYNKRKRNYLLAYAEYKKSRNIKCKVCPDLVFESCQLLIDHYGTFHKLNRKLDFTVLSLGLKHNSTGLYRCTECLTQLNGTRKLCYHLDRHKLTSMGKTKQRRASPAVSTSLDPKPNETRRQGEGATFESVDELSKWNSTPVAAIAPLRSPRSSGKITKEEPEAENQHPCKQCHRAFKSHRALLTHERGHAALAAIKKRDKLSTVNQDIKEFVLYKSGTSKPFRCSCCIYRTNIIHLMRSHILKSHQDIIQRTKEKVESNIEEEARSQREEMELSESPDKRNSPELDDDPEENEESEYSEHADVQRQLNHYNFMAQKNDKTNGNILESLLRENHILYCEICTFNTEHLSSIRRHYMNRHGKKLLKCKDCEFVTGLRKTLELHSQMGHSTHESKLNHHQIIRCPFCLYHTKNKSIMIDHIVLHREDRALPVELNRPKLSRYLRGMVFRCHKCTFSSGSAENLRLHMTKHGGDVKPYRCRLCYFDCSQMAELEAHLSDKHQVLRNHELVSQVDKYNINAKEAENKEFVPDCDEIPQNNIMAEYDALNKMFLPTEETQVKQEPEENESFVSDFQLDDAQPKTTVQKNHEQHSPAKDLNVAFARSAEREQSSGECKNIDEDLSDREEEEKLSRLIDKLKEEPEEAQVDELDFQELQQKMQISKATLEDDTEHRILPQEEHGSKSHEWEDRKLSIKIENVETVCDDKDLSDDSLLDKEGSTTFTPNPTTGVSANSVSANVSEAQTTPGGLKLERHLLTHSTRYTQLKLDCKDGLGVVLESCKPQQKQTPTNWKDTLESRGEIPVLENKRQEEQQQELVQRNEEEETDHLEQRQDAEAEMTAEDETRCKEQEVPNICNDEAAEVPRDDKPFKCHFCGRNLTNASELNRHIVRHGL